MIRRTIAAVLLCAVPGVFGTAHAQEESLDGLVGAGMLLRDGGVPSGEFGVNKWLTPGFGIGMRHSLQAAGDFAQLTSATLNFRAQTTERLQFLFGWSPFAASKTERRGWEAGIVQPLVDVFVRYDVPDQRLDVQIGMNIYAARGAWVHPMVLGVFSF